MKSLPISLVGGENQSRSRHWGSESSVNLYVDVQKTGRTQAALLPWPGEKLFSTGAESTTRGMACHNGLVYLIADQTLVEVDSSGTRTSRGTIPGTTRCSMVSDGENLVIRTGVATYQFDGTLIQVTDSDLENAQTLCVINNQIIYQGTGDRFVISDAGDPTTINALNYATAEAYPDDLVQVYAFNERIYMGGSDSIEVWYNSGTGTPPLDRIQQSTVQVGVASSFSMANSDNYLYFLGSDNTVYRMSAYQPESIAPSSICKEIREATTSDAQGYCVNLDGQHFYILQFPTSSLTLAYSEITGEWIRLSSGTGPTFPRNLMNGYVYEFGKHLVCDYQSGNIYEWDSETYTSNGSTIIRQRDSAPINALQMGTTGRLIMSKAEIIMETGVGNSDVPDPEIMMSCSIDGGRSFTNEDWIKIGREGESVKRVEWYNMKTFYDLVLRVRVSDPCFTAFHGAAITLKGAGW